MDKYFYLKGEDAFGPVTEPTVRMLYKEGKITNGMICPEGTKEWLTFVEVFPPIERRSNAHTWFFAVIGVVCSTIMAGAGVLLMTQNAIYSTGGILIIGMAILLFFMSLFAVAITESLRR